jgi:WG containing repeat
LVKSKSSVARLLDWLPLYSGECSRESWPDIAARANPRWAAVRASSDGLRPVQQPDSLLWGWVDKTGQIAIKPRFAKISGFDGGLAQATQPAHPALWGLVNTAGAWMLPPEWLEIDWRSPQFITVQNQAKEWGALGFSTEGRREPVGPARIIVPLQSEQAWLAAYEAENVLIRNGANSHARMRLLWHGGNEDLTTQEKIKEAIERAGQKGTASLVELAKAQPSLASLAGLFDSPTESDLRQVGLWGMRVRVLSDQGGLFSIKAGDIGYIGCSYPVTLSSFDLMQQAPVMNLPTASHAAIGIAWQHLCFAAGKAG